MEGILLHTCPKLGHLRKGCTPARESTLRIVLFHYSVSSSDHSDMNSCVSAEQYSIRSSSSRASAVVRTEGPQRFEQTGLVQAIEFLPSQNRLVLNLIYVESLSFFEAATVLEIVEGRVHDLHDQAIGLLKRSSRTE